MTSTTSPKLKRAKIRWWAAAFWLVVWQLVSAAIHQDILLVSPLQVLYRLMQLSVTAGFWNAIAHSLLRIGGGFFLAAVTGCGLAIAAARFHFVEELLAPAMLAIKSVPVASFVILALFWVSSKNLSVLIAFLIVLPVLYTNTLSGIRAVDKNLLEMGRVFRLSPLRTLRCLYLPQVLPSLEAGCTVALGLCWKAGIAAEVIGMPQGSIGERLQQAKVYLATSDLFAWTLVIVLVSCGFEKLILFLLRKTIRRLERV